ncbi:acyl-CoA thioesterase-1 [Gramella sp. Hel_I_59]|uniref:arylesterase n=1 Tax=Gramella sp. Hel_I_59 TaxID=1249978 RepID=UPI00115455A8|nr:arylesterase [Gramella sp. Hel_I_59]TQI70468.1 acyl-CoA thioesterase-1 [Gramella sp. Hel_I_59]
MNTAPIFRSFQIFTLSLVLLLNLSCGNEKKSVAAEEKSATEESEDNSEEENSKTILFFGDSITAGYGLETDEAFPNLIQQRLDSLGFDYTVINAGLSGETTAGGLNRIDWVLKQNVEIFVLELGANDGLRGVPLAETRSNLNKIVDYVQEKNSETKIILAGMQIPPNLGADYTTEFRNLFPELAKKENIYLIPFILDGVAGDPELNQQDGIHPTAEAQPILVENIWETLEPLLKN